MGRQLRAVTFWRGSSTVLRLYHMQSVVFGWPHNLTWWCPCHADHKFALLHCRISLRSHLGGGKAKEISCCLIRKNMRFANKVVTSDDSGYISWVFAAIIKQILSNDSGSISQLCLLCYGAFQHSEIHSISVPWCDNGDSVHSNKESGIVNNTTQLLEPLHILPACGKRGAVSPWADHLREWYELQTGCEIVIRI